jgi:riboflavin kinase / FMN adenylyltransferase
MISLSRDVAGPCLAPAGSVVGVGAFDGLHMGHRALLGQVRERARARSVTPAVVTFEPLPRAFFARQPLPRLASMRERLEGLAGLGIEQLMMLRFNRALTQMDAGEFVRRVLVDRLAAREVWVGRDFRFGHARAGDFELLQRMGAELGFEAHAMPDVSMAGERVSSSAIRGHLAAGEFDAAARLLGRRFTMGGHVVRGEQLGRTLGYPTANVRLGHRVSPVHGVFAVRVGFDDHTCLWPGVASLGVRPTVNEVPEPLLEAHLFDFDGDLYGRRICVEFVAHLRDEVRFDSLDALREQMDRDAQRARDLLGMVPASPEPPTTCRSTAER